MDNIKILKEMGVMTWVSNSPETEVQQIQETLVESVQSSQVDSTLPSINNEGITMRWAIVMESVSTAGALFERIKNSIMDLGVQLNVIESDRFNDLAKQLFDCEMVLALGDKAGIALSGEEDTIDNLRGIIFETQNASGEEIPVLVSYHPEQLIKQPSKKSELWDDVVWARSIWIESRL